MIETFEKWFKSLSSEDQKALLDHIFNDKIKVLNEGLFMGPSGILKKGLFTGPISVNRYCPGCGRLL